MEEQILRLLGQKDYAPANVPEMLRLLRWPPNRQQELQGHGSNAAKLAGEPQQETAGVRRQRAGGFIGCDKRGEILPRRRESGAYQGNAADPLGRVRNHELAGRPNPGRHLVNVGDQPSQ